MVNKGMPCQKNYEFSYRINSPWLVFELGSLDPHADVLPIEPSLPLKEKKCKKLFLLVLYTAVYFECQRQSLLAILSLLVSEPIYIHDQFHNKIKIPLEESSHKTCPRLKTGLARCFTVPKKNSFLMPRSMFASAL